MRRCPWPQTWIRFQWLGARTSPRRPHEAFAREIAALTIPDLPREGARCNWGTARAILQMHRAGARGLSLARKPRHFRCRQFLAGFQTVCGRLPVVVVRSPEGFVRRHKSPKHGPRAVRFESPTARRNEKRQRRSILHGIAQEKNGPLKVEAQFFSR